MPKITSTGFIAATQRAEESLPAAQSPANDSQALAIHVANVTTGQPLADLSEAETAGEEGTTAALSVPPPQRPSAGPVTLDTLAIDALRVVADTLAPRDLASTARASPALRRSLRADMPHHARRNQVEDISGTFASRVAREVDLCNVVRAPYLLLRLGQPAAVMADLRGRIGDNQLAMYEHATLANVHLNDNEPYEAIRVINNVFAVAQAGELHAATRDTLSMLAARAHLQAGDFTSAAALLQTGRHLHPSSWSAHARLTGMLAFARGASAAQAMALFDETINQSIANHPLPPQALHDADFADFDSDSDSDDELDIDSVWQGLSPLHMAEFCAFIGEMEEAIDYLQEGVNTPSSADVVSILNSPLCRAASEDIYWAAARQQVNRTVDELVPTLQQMAVDHQQGMEELQAQALPLEDWRFDTSAILAGFQNAMRRVYNGQGDRARIAYELGRTDQARAHVTRELNGATPSFEQSLLLARIDIHSGDAATALGRLVALMNSSPAETDPRDQARAFLLTAEAFVLAGEVDMAAHTLASVRPAQFNRVERAFVSALIDSARGNVSNDVLDAFDREVRTAREEDGDVEGGSDLRRAELLFSLGFADTAAEVLAASQSSQIHQVARIVGSPHVVNGTAPDAQPLPYLRACLRDLTF